MLAEKAKFQFQTTLNQNGSRASPLVDYKDCVNFFWGVYFQ